MSQTMKVIGSIDRDIDLARRDENMSACRQASRCDLLVCLFPGLKRVWAVKKNSYRMWLPFRPGFDAQHCIPA